MSRVETRNMPGAFGVGGGDDRRVDPVEAPCSEIAVRGLGQAVADARDRAEQVGARAQVRDLAQEFQMNAPWADRIGFRILDPAHDLDRPAARLEAWPWPCEGTSVPVAMTAQPAVSASPRFKVGQRGGRDHLDGREAGAVAHVHERQPSLGIASGADPAADRDFAAGGLRLPASACSTLTTVML